MFEQELMEHIRAGNPMRVAFYLQFASLEELLVVGFNPLYAAIDALLNLKELHIIATLRHASRSDLASSPSSMFGPATGPYSYTPPGEELKPILSSLGEPQRLTDAKIHRAKVMRIYYRASEIVQKNAIKKMSEYLEVLEHVVAKIEGDRRWHQFMQAPKPSQVTGDSKLQPYINPLVLMLTTNSTPLLDNLRYVDVFSRLCRITTDLGDINMALNTAVVAFNSQTNGYRFDSQSYFELLNTPQVLAKLGKANPSMRKEDIALALTEGFNERVSHHEEYAKRKVHYANGEITAALHLSRNGAQKLAKTHGEFDHAPASPKNSTSHVDVTASSSTMLPVYDLHGASSSLYPAIESYVPYEGLAFHEAGDDDLAIVIEGEDVCLKVATPLRLVPSTQPLSEATAGRAAEAEAAKPVLSSNAMRFQFPQVPIDEISVAPHGFPSVPMHVSAQSTTVLLAEEIATVAELRF